MVIGDIVMIDANDATDTVNDFIPDNDSIDNENIDDDEQTP